MTQINKVTNGDYKEILSTFLFLTDPRYNCTICKNSESSKKKLNIIRASKNCETDDSVVVHNHRPSKTNWTRCPANYIDYGVKYYINLYLKHESGLKVFTDSVENMSAKLVELIDIIDNLLKEFREKESSKNGQP